MSVKVADGAGVNPDLKINPGASAQVTIYDSSGNEKGTTSSPYKVLSMSGRNLVGQYACSTFRILGTAVSPQNLASIENPAVSGRNIAIKRLTIQSDNTALLATVPMQVVTSRPTSLPTGGSIISAVDFLSSYPSSVAVVRGGSGSDGGVATPIIATAGNRIWQQFIDRMQTAVGFIGHPDSSLLPQYIDLEPFILLPGESLLIQGITAAAATTNFLINLSWEEYT